MPQISPDHKEELREALREIYDDNDFVEGNIATLGTDENCVTMLDFISMAGARGDSVSASDLNALSLVIDRKTNRLTETSE